MACKINKVHCEQCGSSDPEDITTGDGYTKCCNELLVYSASECRDHHGRS